MSGVACVVSKRDVIPRDAGTIERMLQRIRHRGPDDMGFFRSDFVHIGMCRLATTDLGTRGLCPYIWRNGRFVIAYDGEIYNFAEIREELKDKGYSFGTNSDIEVVLLSYVEWGERCLERFNGMFAFIIADFDKNVLFVARDKIGEKPIYWYEDGRTLLFSSEIKGILEVVDDVEVELTEEFRTMEMMSGQDTIFKGIKSLPPASYMILRGIGGNFEGYDIREYWDVRADIEYMGEFSRNDEKALVDRLDELINDAVRIRSRVDVPYGVYLSGGLDSSVIACILRPPVAFYCHFPYGDKYDELEYAKEVAGAAGSELVIVKPSRDDFERYLPYVIYYMDVPIGSFSMFPLFMLAMRAREDVKVVFAGEGADELFGGYIRYLVIYHVLKAYKIPQFRNYEPMLEYFFGTPLKAYAKLSNRSELPDSVVERILSRYFKFKDPINNIGYADLKLSLVSILQMEDRMASAFGIENRTPFLDHRIVEFAFSIPSDMKIRDYQTKYILRKVAQRYVPKSSYERITKKGLVAPINLWLGKSSGPRGEFDRTEYMRICMELFRKIYIDREFRDIF